MYKSFKQKTKIQKMFEHKKKYLKEKFAKDNRTQELAKLYKEKEKINKTITNLYEDKISSNISLETFKILIKKASALI